VDGVVVLYRLQRRLVHVAHFLLSGLFVQHSIARKGVGVFLRDRLLRWDYLSSSRRCHRTARLLPDIPPDVGARRRRGILPAVACSRQRPAGPAWFIWVLLAFDIVAAALFAFAPQVMAWLGRVVSGSSERPIVLFLILAAVSAVTYIPIAIHFGSEGWTVFAPAVAFDLPFAQLFSGSKPALSRVEGCLRGESRFSR
jgi:hypothetical protein